MKFSKLLILLLSFFFCLSQSYAQSSPISIMKEIGKMNADLIVTISHSSNAKNLKTKIELVKNAVKDAEFEITKEGEQIKQFSFKGSGHGCASDDFGVFVVAIKEGQVQSCYVADKKE